MTDQTRGVIAVLAGALCVSTVPTAVKFGLAGQAEPFQLLAPRLILGTMLLWVWVGVTRPHRIRIDRRGLAACGLAGLLNAISLSLYYFALTRLAASITNITFSIYPALLLLLWLAVGERVTRLDWIRLATALVGIWLVAGPGGTLDPLGLALALGGAAAYAVYVRVVHARLVGYAISTQVLWTITCMSILMQLPAALFGSESALDARGWGVVLWTAILGTALAPALNVTGIRLIGGGQAALLAPFETFLTVSWATLFLGERLSGLQLLGGAMVITSVGLAALGRRWRVWVGAPRVTTAVKVRADTSPAARDGSGSPEVG